MTEFEKQWKCGMLSGSPTSLNSGATPKEAARFNWRAALKWWLGEGTGGNIRFKDVDVRIDLMQKELEEEDNGS